LFPLTLNVEIADLVTQGDEFGLTGDARRLEQVDDDTPVDTQLVVVSRQHGLAFQIVEAAHFVKTVRDASINIERNVIVVFLVA